MTIPKSPKRWWFPIPALAALLALAPFTVRADDAPAAASACKAPHVSVEQQPATREITDLGVVGGELRELRLSGKLDPKEVLVVFDIDNTLLAMESLLGSDEWFNLQYAEFEKPTPPASDRPTYDGPLPDAEKEPRPPAVRPAAWKSVDSLEHLLDLQSALFVLKPMRETQPEASDVVAALGARGYTTIALTSRGPANRYATLRELGRNQISFKEHAVVVGGKPAAKQDFEWTEAELASVLTPYEIALGGGAGKLAGRRVRYADGVLMTSGANKGFALRMLLAAATEQARYRRIVFIDDTAKHHITVRDAYACVPSIVVATYWNRREHACARALYDNPCEMEALADEVHELEHASGAMCGDLVTTDAR